MKIEGSNFEWEEFVHPLVWQSFGYPRVKWFVSDFMLKYAFLLREVIDGPVIVNNWHSGGQFIGRGFRPSTYRPKGGAILSQHYLSNALDVSSPYLKPEQIVRHIFDNKDRFIEIGLTTIEDLSFTRTWVHGDCRKRIEGLHPSDGFLFVKP